MKLSLGILSVTVAVCALAVVSRTPYVLASTPVPATGATDRDVLVALYHATGGDNWTNNENWLSDAPIGTWYGVTTDESGRVIELILWFNNLGGTIPPELGDLTALTRLDFSGNQLSGTIPTELGNLTALTRLDLDRNRLSGTIPPELGNLANLDALYLAGNRLEGCQPAVWKYVADNDLDQLGLPYCAAATAADSAAADSGMSWSRFIGLRMAINGPTTTTGFPTHHSAPGMVSLRMRAVASLNSDSAGTS